MPAFLKTPEDEHLWSKAKAVAAQEGHHEDWPYVTGIFKKMKGGAVSKRAAADPHAAYMDKVASDAALVGAGLGAAAGYANASALGVEFKLAPRSRDEAKRDQVIEAAAGLGLGGAAGHAMSHPGFEAAYQGENAGRRAGAVMERLGRALPDVLRRKVAAGPAFNLFGSPEQVYDRDTHVKLLRAKADLSRAKLVNSPGFQKLGPKGQKQILAAHDNVHQTIEEAVMAGKYGGI
jgi:hypothetical protein